MSHKSPLALLSVTDKTGVVDFAKDLSDLGYTLLSTGGTAQVLREAGLEVFDVADYAGSPEIMNGRVKTLHPKVHGGILMDRSNPSHLEEATEHKILPIDIVVVNLYQFERNAVNRDLSLEEAINFIDIGGPTMLRAAAKNYRYVAPVIDPNDYQRLVDELRGGDLSMSTRIQLAYKVFAHTSRYDEMIEGYFEKAQQGPNEGVSIPEHLTLNLQRASKLRYGENPHQDAGFYTFQGASDGLQNARVLQGKELSYNNLVDLDAALGIVKDLSQFTAVAVIKHTNPCGVAASPEKEVKSVFMAAFEADAKSAFGGIVACNRNIDGAAADAMAGIFLECIAAPGFSEDAIEIFKAKKNLRLLEVPFLSRENSGARQLQYKSIQGGMLVQTEDVQKASSDMDWTFVTEEKTQKYDADLSFAMIVCKHVKSNAIVYAKDLKTLAVGAGQMSRIDAAKFAAQKAQEEGRSLKGAVLASDAFFPFRDTVDFAASHGVRAIIQPGGSKRDQESVDACNQHKMTMIFTGTRHFKH